MQLVSMAGTKAVVWKAVKQGQAMRMKVKATAGNTIYEEVAMNEQQAILWQNYFLNPTQWWDNRKEKRSSSHPDFRHKRLKGALWLDNRNKPAWVDSQLSRWDADRDSHLNEASISISGAEIVHSSQLEEVVRALEDIVQRGSYVHNNIFYCVLKESVAQKDLDIGRRVHALVLRSGCGSDEFLANHIIGMYASHGKLEEATQAFTKVASPNAFMWASIISANSRHGQADYAIALYQQMRQRTVKPNSHVFVAALKACATATDLDSGKEVHADILESGMEGDMFVGNSLVNMYAKCGSLDNARKVFDSLPKRDVVTWNAMIAGYVHHGLGQESLALYSYMQLEGIIPVHRVTFVCLLQACANTGALQQGKQLHAQALEKGLEADLAVGSCLVDMYAKCDSLEDARRVFKAMPNRNVVTWNSMIAGYAKHCHGQEALACFAQMQEDGITPDRLTFVSLLRGCASLGSLHQGKQIHAQIQGIGLEEDVVVGSCLVDMYLKCRSPVDALKVFESLTTKNVVTWTAMIAGYAQQRLRQEAIGLYARMQEVSIIPADRVAFVSLLQAFARIGALHQGRHLHTQIRLAGLEEDLVVNNCLVNMYVKCGSLEEARRVFDELTTRDVVTWTTMIAGYAQQGHGRESLALYASMHQDGITLVDVVTFGCLLQACASTGDLRLGKQIHAEFQRSGLEGDIVLGNCLVDMYAKCGSLEGARQVFEHLPTRNVSSWTCMIAAYTRHGLGRAALAVYDESGIDLADTVTLGCLLRACANVGALQRGKQLHAQIQERGLASDVILGSCLVDMYARCGSMEDASRLFERLPSRDLVTWNSLLSGYAQNSECHQYAMPTFEEMLEQGVKPDGVTFNCLLVACSRQGLVEEGQQYFKMMVEDHGIAPDRYHYACMVDLFGRSGWLERAEHVVRTMPFENDIVSWTSLLTACKSHMDVDRGRQCFDHLISLEPGNASAYVLMANAYADQGRWTDVERIESWRKYAGARKKPAMACIEVQKKVHEFIVGEERGGISSRLRSLSSRLKDVGSHVPQTDLVLKAVSESKKEDVLCGHAEKLALAYGLLNTPDGTTLLVTKNLRMCSDCHSSSKTMSRLEKREIIVRDTLCVHRFVDGFCSCGGQE